MKSKYFLIYPAAAMLFSLTIFFGIKAFAQEQSKEDIHQEFCERLRGAEGVFVYVEVIAQDKTDEKSFIDELQKEAESQLKNSKIKVLTKEESDLNPSRPRLAINLITYKDPSQKNVILYSFRIVHFEVASLLRTERYVEGICWDSGLYIGMERRTAIKNKIREQLDKYIKDYLSVNQTQ
jgi:hypothetical protein